MIGKQESRWYILQVHSGLESRAIQHIKERATKKGMLERFEEMLVPTEEVTEIRSGKKVKLDKKYFPGYVLVKLALDDDIQGLIQAVQGVSGFLGTKGRPSPISEAEVGRILKQVKDAKDNPRSAATYSVGEQVKVLDGPFASFSGFVEEIEDDKQRLKVSVTIFGRATPISLMYEQVEKIS